MEKGNGDFRRIVTANAQEHVVPDQRQDVRIAFAGPGPGNTEIPDLLLDYRAYHRLDGNGAFERFGKPGEKCQSIVKSIPAQGQGQVEAAVRFAGVLQIDLSN